MRREDFPMLLNDLIYFDNGATTFKPKCVIDSMNEYYYKYCANSHRGDYDISLKVDNLYEDTRNMVRDFINAESSEEVIFTKGTTESINMITFGFMREYLQKGDEVLITKMEHASNVLPWYVLEKERGIKVKFIPLEDNLVTLENVKRSITSKTKVISIAHITNTYGDIRDIKEITKIAHEHNIIVAVDGAQSVPHIKVDVKDLDIDFLSFSAHKMLGPTGLGILYGKKELLNQMNPINYGGGMNEFFESNKDYELKSLPIKLEAGTQNIAGVIGFRQALKYLTKMGLDNIFKHEMMLKKYLVTKLQEVPNVTVYNANTDSGIVLFNINNVFAGDTSNFLNYHHICVRAGNHCAKMVKELIKIKNTCRISLYIYNTKEEIDKFIEIMKNIEDIYKIIL